jgi:hypothetical protein
MKAALSQAIDALIAQSEQQSRNRQKDEQIAMAIYKEACEMEIAGFDSCSRHANILAMLRAAPAGSWEIEDRMRYISGRIISGEYAK